ncbi:hypothetical protein AXF42_Ash016632 [Apostasia shenzhenica]|uniref:Uncharacterized protein n=1 Tax=Apostasia shenzhenica TaxID=1088818 RepID=A0A2I0A1M6_9ASPA|nr:hypothetical protein AXF42_Ash016632 [Apostasia shenzhenica]
MDSLKLRQPKPSYSSQPSTSTSDPASTFTPRFAQFIEDAFQELGHHIQEQDLKILSLQAQIERLTRVTSQLTDLVCHNGTTLEILDLKIDSIMGRLFPSKK